MAVGRRGKVDSRYVPRVERPAGLFLFFFLIFFKPAVGGARR